MLSICLITYNRLDYTKQTLESLYKNTKTPHEIIVVDNGSEDGTPEYLLEEFRTKRIQRVRLNKENLYPGKACNQGWDMSCPHADILIRSDNDLFFNIGWDEQVVKAFKEFPKLGQLGLIDESYRFSPSQNTMNKDYVCYGKTMKLLAPLVVSKTIGGPCAIPSELFKQKGIRWSEEAWNGKIRNEDWNYSLKIQEMGKIVRTLYGEYVIHKGFGDFQKYYGYYYKAYRDRGLITYFHLLLKQEKNGNIVAGKVVY